MLGEQASVSENGTVKTPRRPREYLTEGEIDRLMTIARQSDRYGHRDATAILVAFRHGLRSSELVALGMGPNRPDPQDHPAMAGERG